MGTMMKQAALIAIAIVGLSSPIRAQDTPATAANTSPPQTQTAATITEGLAAWQEVYGVASHPRCANCHVGEDNIPVWSGPSYGKRQSHGMNINAGESRIGAEYIQCQTCHFSTQRDLPHAPPGAPNWHLAPVEMQWIDKTSAEICQQLKNPETNGDRSLAEIAEHIRDDALVAWGWAPGPGREPAPGSAEQTFRALKTWAAAGAPCPQG